MRCGWCGGALTTAGCDCTVALRQSASPRCACCGAVHRRSARFCAQCGASFIGGAGSNEAIERRQITFVFCDLVGSTSLSDELDPEDYRKILFAYREAVNVAMRQFGGCVERYRGDGTLVYFGYPEAHEDDAERAFHAALQAIQSVGAIGSAALRRLEVRIGIATGLVVVSDVEGSEERAAMGDAPNIASRLQSYAKPNSIVVDDSSRRLAGDLFEFTDIGFLNVKGLAAPMRAWGVLGARPVASRFEARREGVLSPLFGREDELNALVQLWQAARSGHGKIALVTGEAGIGKSRLVAALLESARHDACATYCYFCSPYRQASPLHPFIQQLEHHAGFTASDSGATKLNKLENALPGIAPEDLALLAELLNLPVTDANLLASISSPVKRRRTMQALMALVQRSSMQLPTLIVFEDVQWIDDTSRELLLMVCAMLQCMPIFLVVLMRPEEHTEFDRHAGVARIHLNPLSAALSTALVQHVSAGAHLATETIQDIVRRTDGIPLFVEEVTRATQEGLTRADRADSSHEGAPLSMLLRASLQARLNRLGAAREVVEAAAVIGRDFSAQLIECVLGNRKDSAVSVKLEQLLGSGLVVRRNDPEPTYMFKHALIRDAAYEIIGRDMRRSLHEKVASVLVGQFPDVVLNHPEILARHYTEAGIVEKAVEQWLLAGRNALRRSAMVEALTHLNRGSALVTTTKLSSWRLQNELALTICVGMAQIATQGYAVESTGKTFTHARTLCEQLGNPPPLLAVLHGLWTHALLRADFPSAESQAAHVLERGEAKADPLWRLMGHRFTGVTSHPHGRFERAIAQLQTGLELYDASQLALYMQVTVDDPRVVMLTYLSWSQMCSGRFAEAIHNSNDAVASAQQVSHIYTLAHALTGAAFVALTILSPAAGLARVDQLCDALVDSDIAYYHAVETIFRGWCLAALGQHREALAALRQGVAGYRATESVLYLSGFLRMSAEAHGRAGEIDTAMRQIEEALAIMNATDQRWDEAEMHRVHGVLLRAAGQEAAAEQAIVRACNIASAQGAKLWELRARCDLFERHTHAAHAAAGEIERLEQLVAACGVTPELPELPDIQRAGSILEECRVTVRPS